MAQDILIGDVAGNFYKFLWNTDRSFIDIDIPQYHSRPEVIYRCGQVDRDSVCIPLKVIPLDKLKICLEKIRHIPGVRSVTNPYNDEYLIIKNLHRTASGVVTLGDNTPADVTKLARSLSKGAEILINIWIRGVICIEHHAELDIRIAKCKYIETITPISVKLEFADQKEIYMAPPRHFLNMFNQLPAEQRECSICMETIQANLALTKCYHFFHTGCIRRVINRKCPICQSDL
jgi:hypothetical protein